MAKKFSCGNQKCPKMAKQAWQNNAKSEKSLFCQVCFATPKCPSHFLYYITKITRISKRIESSKNGLFCHVLFCHLGMAKQTKRKCSVVWTLFFVVLIQSYQQSTMETFRGIFGAKTRGSDTKKYPLNSDSRENLSGEYF